MPTPIHNPHEEQYTELVRYALGRGVRKPNRTGVDTISVFGYQMRFDLRDGTIPMLTTKKMFTRGIIREILWYLQGTENIQYLKDHNVTIWDEWADESGNLGPVYGVQWRNWEKYVIAADQGHESGSTRFDVQVIDQIANLVHKLKTNPNDRRMLVSAWNVAEIDNMALPPCHYSFQCYTRPLTSEERMRLACKRYHINEILDNTTNQTVDGWMDEAEIPKYELSMLLNQRSCDIGLGVPFNIVQYSILLRMFAEVANMSPGDFIWNGGDVHVYENHIDALTEQLTREPKPAPMFRFARKVTDIDDFKFEDFIIHGYECHPTIKMDVAV